MGSNTGGGGSGGTTTGGGLAQANSSSAAARAIRRVLKGFIVCLTASKRVAVDFDEKT